MFRFSLQHSYIPSHNLFLMNPSVSTKVLRSSQVRGRHTVLFALEVISSVQNTKHFLVIFKIEVLPRNECTKPLLQTQICVFDLVSYDAVNRNKVSIRQLSLLFPSHSLHVSAPTGHLQVRIYNWCFTRTIPTITDPLYVHNLTYVLGTSTRGPQ
jgi:hypothetical protein